MDNSTKNSLNDWLKENVSVTLPKWVVLALGAALFILTVIALD